MITPQELQDFENEIADIDSQGLIHAPVHLRSSDDFSYENGILAYLKDIRPNDYLFGCWDSHCLALIKGIPPERVKEKILEGHSISLCFPEYRFYCTGIVGSLLGAAVGVAWAIKQKGLDEVVYAYIGDMQAQTGIFHECLKYSWNFDLPILWIVGDNGVSVLTDTKATWGEKGLPWYRDSRFYSKVRYFRYNNTWSHSGRKGKVSF